MMRKGYCEMRKLVLLVTTFQAHMKKQNISAYASSTAFFFFLSVVPMLILVCTILPYTPLTENNLVETANELMSEQIAPLAVQVIAEVYDKASGIMPFAIIATVWSAAKGVMALMRGLNAINSVEEKRNYFVIRGVASLYTIGMLIVVILSLFLNVFGRQIVNLALHRFPRLKDVVDFAMNFRFIVVWVILSLMFAAIYTYVPNVKLKFKEQLPGAMFSAIVWNIFSWCFSIYIGFGNSYGIYGSLSIIIIVLLWMYFCMYIILIGAYLNYYFRPVNEVLVNPRKVGKNRDESTP